MKDFMIDSEDLHEEKELREYMTFHLDSMHYAIELNKVREILTYPELITTLPNSKDYIKGLINLRGEVVPILDLRMKFLTGTVRYDDNTGVIAVITEDKRMIGIVVDKVDDVKKIDISQLSPISSMGSSIPLKYLKGFVRIDDNDMLVIMDIEIIVDRTEY